MKTFRSKVATGLVLCTLTAGMSGGAMASADTVTLCKSIKTLDPVAFEQNFGNLGQCVSFFGTMPVEGCQILQEEGRLEELGWATQGECVSDLVM
ncbi:MAG: hypothetical protein ABFS02_11455 [Pseudomonadota bacterium]